MHKEYLVKFDKRHLFASVLIISLFALQKPLRHMFLVDSKRRPKQSIFHFDVWYPVELLKVTPIFHTTNTNFYY
jgi:hypothetical protein